jgi:hypothetical protein
MKHRAAPRVRATVVSVPLRRCVSTALFVFSGWFGVAEAKFVHRWSFDANGSDSVGGATAVLQSGATVSGGELQLNGSSTAYATLPIDGTLSTLGSSTIEAWATYNALTPWARIFDFGDGDRTANPSQGFLALTGSPEFCFPCTTSSSANFGITPTSNTDPGQVTLFEAGIPGPGVEVHYAVVFDALAQLGILYVNGVEVASATSFDLTPSDIVSVDSTEHNWLGRSRFNQDTYMSGSINEFRIYDTALSATEIGTSFDLGPDNVVPEPGIIGLLALGVAVVAYRRKRT